jgi:serine/threonine protein kinase
VQVVDNLRENNLKVQEIRVMMHLKHRNIVEMCDFYTSNNQLCIVMEYADGGDLRHEVIKARNGKTTISEELVSVWLIQARAPICARMHVCSGRALANRKTHKIHANNLKIHVMIRVIDMKIHAIHLGFLPARPRLRLG